MINELLVVCKVKISYLFNVSKYNKKEKKKNSVSKFDTLLNIYLSTYLKKIIICLILFLLFILFPIQFLSTYSFDTIFFTMFFVTLAFLLAKSPLSNYKEDAEYSVEMLKLPKEDYIKCNYLVSMFETFILFVLTLLFINLIYSFSLFTSTQIFILSFTFLTIENICIYLNISLHRHRKKIKIASLIILLLGYLFISFTNVNVNNFYEQFLIIATFINILILFNIFNSNNYDEYYNYLFNKYKRKKIKLKSYEKSIHKNDMVYISTEKCKNPYQQFINLFDKRYKKILPKTYNISFIFMSFIILFLIAYSILYPEYNEEINEFIKYNSTYILFILCLLNNSRYIIKSFYEKCDIYMFNHNFYKDTKVQLKLYFHRLIYILKKNMSNSILFGIGLSLIYYLTNNNNQVIEYFYLFLLPILIFVLICIYYLTIYYVFNPYNKKNKIKFINLLIIYIPFYIGFELSRSSIIISDLFKQTLIIFIILNFVNFIIMSVKFKLNNNKNINN